MLFWEGVLLSIEVKFPGPLQIPTAGNRCENYSSQNVLIVIIYKDNVMI